MAGPPARGAELLGRADIAGGRVVGTAYPHDRTGRHGCRGPARSNQHPAGGGVGKPYAVGAGMGLLPDDGEGLGVTQVSSAVRDDRGTVRRAHGAAAQAPPLARGAARLGRIIDHMFYKVKGGKKVPRD